MSRHSGVRRRGPWRHVDYGPSRHVSRWQAAAGRRSRAPFPPAWRPSARRYRDPPAAARRVAPDVVTPLSKYLAADTVQPVRDGALRAGPSLPA